LKDWLFALISKYTKINKILTAFPSSLVCRFLLAKLTSIQLIAYSLPAHKEFRFLLPALQLAMPYCGLGAAYLIEARQGQNKRAGGKISAAAAATSFLSSPTNRRRLIIAMLGLQVPVTLFFSLYHQRAQVQVMSYLQANHQGAAPSPPSVLFLTPCHTTPYYSYIHKANSMRFFDCSPPGMFYYLFKIVSRFPFLF
jgi:GPI mannosyltransferase 3